MKCISSNAMTVLLAFTIAASPYIFSSHTQAVCNAHAPLCVQCSLERGENPLKLETLKPSSDFQMPSHLKAVCDHAQWKAIGSSLRRFSLQMGPAAISAALKTSRLEFPALVSAIKHSTYLHQQS